MTQSRDSNHYVVEENAQTLKICHRRKDADAELAAIIGNYRDLGYDISGNRRIGYIVEGSGWWPRSRLFCVYVEPCDCHIRQCPPEKAIDEALRIDPKSDAEEFLAPLRGTP